MSYDSRLRCDFVDLYFTLYGTRRPNCTPTPELSGVLKTKTGKPEVRQPDTRSFTQIEKEASVEGPHFTGLKRKATSPLSPREREPTVTTSATDEHNLGIVTVEIEAADEDDNKLKVRELLTDTIAEGLTVEEPIKKEIFSDNSASLPGISGTQFGPTGFEPGMFSKKDQCDSKSGHSSKSSHSFHEKSKKRKKEKKKHKHKHRHHKHGKDKNKEKKDLGRLNVKEETLSSLSSTPSPTDGKEFIFTGT